MLFTSYEFIGFLVVLFILYYLVPKKAQWVLLLLGSYVFYYLSGPSYLIYILAVTLVVYLCARKIESLRSAQEEYISAHKAELSKEERKAYKESVKKKQKVFFLIGLLAGLFILGFIKYTNFVISNINGVMNAFGSGKSLSFLNLALPMGISFYTFQSLGYLIDVKRGTIRAEKNPFKFALFVSFFPQLIQGPISRFSDLSKSLYEEHKFDINVFKSGVQRILWGYFKKVVIADRILTAVKVLISDTDTYNGVFVFVGMMFYAVELYADFTGGIDITIGIAEALGITVTENFNRPFFSKSIKEYWRRWHITMGTWFTDYIFYPITVSKGMLKLSKKSRAILGETIGKRVPVYLSSFTVWLATGVWHGASWNFIVWGLGNFVVIMISQELEPLYKKFHDKFHLIEKRPYQGFMVIRTIFIMSLLRTFDCYRDVPLTFRMVGGMFTTFNVNRLFSGELLALGLSIYDYIVLIIGVIILFMVSMIGRSGSVRAKINALAYPVRFMIWFSLFLAIIIFGAYGVGYDASQFIYNQF